jgi:flagellar basal body L-ring protein FlgH
MPAPRPSLEPLADPADAAAPVTSTVHPGWYDADASSWEAQTAALFEAKRASTPGSTIAVGTARASATRRTIARPGSRARQA